MAFLGIENVSSSSSSIPSSSTPGSECKYEFDVFLSFRGTDTRNNFTDHLYDRLKQEGIVTFRDDERLEQGTEINSGLLRAIDESKIAVVVLSKQYASSRWCLIELAKIVECMDKKKLTVLPMFHYVDPRDVRNQRGTFEEAFARHENKYDIEDVKTWRAALTKFANLSGWHLVDKSESEVIKKIIQRINSELNREVPFVSEHFVGMDSRVKEMLDLCLDERLDCACLIGICGMGGIGKTTLAQEIYNRIFLDFEVSNFIPNVREESKSRRLVSLQKNILSKILMGTEKNISNVEEGKKFLRNRLCNKKVLIVLDDVNDEKQLKALAGGKDWFGPRSIIIVTSRDSHLLRSYWDGVIDIYMAKELNDDEALELFSLKAFKKPSPEENYVDLSKNFVSYAKGLPLALRVLGSSLFGKTHDAWRSARDKLEAKPNRVIMDVLEMSVVGLDDAQRDLFLDIACFFKGMAFYCIRDTLESLGHYTYDIDVLKDKSLMTITSNGALGMHDLLEEMGQDIVRRESPEEPGKRSRLWLYEDIMHVLKNNTGTEFVKGIVLKTHANKKEQLSAEAFSKMKNLRLLIICHVLSPQGIIGGPIQFSQGLIYLSNKLRVLIWHGCPLKSMPTEFQPDNLIELRMHCSHIKQLWKRIMILNKLKLLDLSGSQNLIVFPDLSGTLNLKQLILRGCTKLRKIHASIGDLKQLIQLDLNGCKKISSLPENIGNVDGLEELEVGGTAIRELPPSMVHLKNLKKLSFSGCDSLFSEPSNKLLSFPLFQGRSSDPMDILTRTLPGLSSLTHLDLSYCNLRTIPDVIGGLSSLEYLNLSNCNLRTVPDVIFGLSSLKYLNLSYSNLQTIPDVIDGLSSLKYLNLSCCNLQTVPDVIGGLSSLKYLNLSCCNLRTVPDVIGGLFSLTHLDLSYCNLRTVPDVIGDLSSLEDLNLGYCNLRSVPDVIGCLSSLFYLNLSGNNFVCLPKSFIRLSRLDFLSLNGCTDLQFLPELPPYCGVIDVAGCSSLKTLLPITPADKRFPSRLFNCFKLINNDFFLIMLSHYFHAKIQSHWDWIELFIPGIEIPKWFSHQSEGTTLNLKGPSDFMGIALCAVFVLRPHHSLPMYYTVYFDCEGIGIGHKISCCQGSSSIYHKYVKIDSHHLLFRYLSIDCFYDESGNRCSKMDANGFIQVNIRTRCSKMDDNGFTKVNIRTGTEGLEVMKCGACLVYDKDIEDLKQTMAGSSRCIITPYEDDLDDSAKDTKIKHSHDEFDGDEAGPSGEATNSEVDI